MTAKAPVVARPPRAPGGLRSAAKRLWRTVLGGFELRPDELVVLEAACRLADETADLEAALAAAPAMISGSKGQLRVNPIFAEVRNHRLALGRLLAQLGLADAGADAGSTKSTAGRRLARQRWSGGN